MHVARPRRKLKKCSDQAKHHHDRTSIVFFLHLLFWSTLYTIGSCSYTLGVHVISPNAVPSVVLLLIAVSPLGIDDGLHRLNLAKAAFSLVYLCLHHVTTLLFHTGKDLLQPSSAVTIQRLATILCRLSVPVWLFACGMSIVFTMGQPSLCSMHEIVVDTKARAIDAGVSCVVQRTGLGAGVSAE